MGFIKRLFAGDPQRDLERAAALLKSGEVEEALELASRAAGRAQPADKERAASLVEQARDAVVVMAIEKASVAESSEYFDDAVEWLDMALKHVVDGARRHEIEVLRQSLVKRSREAEFEPWELPSEPEAGNQTQIDPGIHYQALIDMLVEEVAEHYEGRLPAFRIAYVALNEGRVAEAHEAFEILAASADADPVVVFERGRSRLAVGDVAGSVPDFEAAWPTFGDGALDLTGELSVPGLWAEAMLALGQPVPVIERIAKLADPIDAAPVSERYAQALMAAEHFEDARDFLAVAVAKNPSRDLFAYQLAQTFEQLGERTAAIDCLEIAIAPSCTTGCAPRQKYLPSFRALVSLYLADESQPERVHELMTVIARALGGRLTSGDHTLLARYYEQIGDAEAAEHAHGHAQRLRQEAAPLENVDAGPAPVGGQMRAPL